MLIKFYPNVLLVEIQESGEVEFDDLYKAIRNWEASPVGITYSELIDGSGNDNLPDGSKSPKIMIFKGGWKLKSLNHVSIIGGIITGKNEDGAYNPISDDSKDKITIYKNISEWEPSEDQIRNAQELGKKFGDDWEIIYPQKIIQRKKNASNDKHRVLGLYWFIKKDRLENENLRKFDFPIKGDDRTPAPGLVRNFELLPGWKIKDQDLDYLIEDILIQNGKILNQPTNITSKSFISLKDKSGVRAVLGVVDLAKELSQIIEKMSPEQDKMIGVFGKWGRGKTFLFKEIWKILSPNKLNQKVELHAWKYQDTPAIWAYLYENFAQTYITNSKNSIHRKIRRINLNIIRKGWSPLVIMLISMLISVISIFLIPLPYKLNMVLKIILGIGIGPLVSSIIFYFMNRNTARELFKKYYENVSFENVLGIQAEVEKELKYLLRAMSYGSVKILTKDNWTAIKSCKFKDFNFCHLNKKTILFVDDIDRCSEDKIVQIIDSLRVMLEDETINKNLIIITAIDGDVLKRAVMSKYDHMVSIETGSNSDLKIEKLSDLTSEYFDKLFIMSIRLGKLNVDEIGDFFSELSKEDFEEDPFLPITAKDTQQATDESNQTNLENESKPESNSASYLKAIKISQTEFDLLMKYFKMLPDTTPRQIRILYYKFLLAKNLLKTSYRIAGRSNIWKQAENLEIMIQLLIQYSKDRSKHTDHITLVNENKISQIDNQLLQSKEINEIDYLKLLRVLDIVIAY